MSSRDFHVVNMLMIFLFLDIYYYLYIFLYITYIFHQKQPGGPPFLPHVTVRFSCAKATYNNLYFFGGFALILRVVNKNSFGEN